MRNKIMRCNTWLEIWKSAKHPAVKRFSRYMLDKEIEKLQQKTARLA